jgi:hypothetical protein
MLSREGKTALPIAFPEVDAGTKPVVGVLAWLESLTSEEAFADDPIASVESKHK